MIDPTQAYKPDRAISSSETPTLSSRGFGSRIDQGFVWLATAFGVSVLLLIGWMLVVIASDANPALKAFGWGFIASQEWDIDAAVFGALPYVFGTLVSSAIAFFLATPIGVAVAIITSENFLPPTIRGPLAFTVELIAAIPSVIIGLWGIYVVIPLLRPGQIWLHETLSWIPLFSTSPYGPSILIAGLILAMMIVPTVAAISRDVLLAVPSPLRSASMALGATRWETIFRVLLPAGSSGIMGAAMLALGRALGETMAATMVIGNTPVITASILSPGYSIPAVLANEFPEALDPIHIGALMYLALILFGLTLLVNIGATFLVQLTSLERG